MLDHHGDEDQPHVTSEPLASDRYLDVLEGQPGTMRSGEAIASEVQMRILRELLLGRSEIAVSVEDGVARLHGSVWSQDLRRRAENLARTVPGVADVENGIKVRG